MQFLPNLLSESALAAAQYVSASRRAPAQNPKPYVLCPL